MPRARPASAPTRCCSARSAGRPGTASPVRPEQGLLALRSALGCYANIRPARRYTRHTTSPLREELVAELDLVIVRELIGGIYFGERELGDDDAYDTCRYTAFEIRRIVERACVLAEAPLGPRHERRQGERARDLEALAARRDRGRRAARRRDARPPARRLDGDAARRAPGRLRRDRHREPLRRRALRPRRRGQRRHRARALGLAGRRRPGHLRADPRHGARHRRPGQGQPRGRDPLDRPAARRARAARGRARDRGRRHRRARRRRAHARSGRHGDHRRGRRRDRRSTRSRSTSTSTSS